MIIWARPVSICLVELRHHDLFSQVPLRIFSDEPQHSRSHRRAALSDNELPEFAADAAGIEGTRDFARNDARWRAACGGCGREN